MVEITLFELHSHGDSQFGPSSLPGVGSDEDEDDEFETDVDYETDEEGGGIGPVPVLVALVLLVGLAAVAKKFMGGSDEDPVPLEESDDITATAD